MKTVFYRVDEKFIHAQINYGWLPFLEVKRLIGVSEKIANDPVSSQIYLEALSSDVVGTIVTPESAVLSHLNDSETDRILVLFSSLEDAEKYCKAGGRMKALNLGGIYARPGRKKYLNYIHLTDDEVERISNMGSTCTDIYCQDTPRSQPVSVTELLGKAQD